jgi:hypothetical protein
MRMIETFFGLDRLGYTDGKGMLHLLQLARSARELSDMIVFRSPPLRYDMRRCPLSCKEKLVVA